MAGDGDRGYDAGGDLGVDGWDGACMVFVSRRRRAGVVVWLARCNLELVGIVTALIASSREKDHLVLLQTSKIFGATIAPHISGGLSRRTYSG